MKRRTIALTLWSVLVLLFVLPGCTLVGRLVGANKQAEETMDHLSSSLQDGDYEKLKTICKLSEESFTVLSAIFRNVGKIEDRSLVSLEAGRTNDTEELSAVYRIEFERAVMTFQFEMANGKVHSISIDGDERFEAAREEAAAAVAAGEDPLTAKPKKKKRKKKKRKSKKADSDD